MSLLDQIQKHQRKLVAQKSQVRKAVGKRIYILRRKAGLTQEQLSILAGIERNQVSNIERGRSGPAITTLYSIALALRVEAKRLLPTRKEIGI